MAIDKIVTTRKQHFCTCCNEPIPKGAKAWYFANKQPRYDADDNQIGIEYFKAYYCYDKNAVYGDNFEDGFEIYTMVPSCELANVDAKKGNCTIYSVSQRSELVCEHDKFERCRVIEKCCDTCKYFKPYKQTCG